MTTILVSVLITILLLILLTSVRKNNHTRLDVEVEKQKILTLLVEKSGLVKEIINFAGIAFKDESLPKTVGWNFSNYNQNHLKKTGIYSSSVNGCKITIYIRKLKTVEEIVNVVLHEMAHHHQYQLDQKNYDRNYNRFSRKVGYYHNPYEIEAREFAKKWSVPCANHLIEKGMLEFI